MLTLAGWQEDLCALKLWPEQARANRMMWLMDSDLVGLRTSADAGLSLNDCSDLFIHQADCDKAASAAQSRWRNFPRPRCCSKAFASPQEGEGHPAELRAVGLLLEIWTLSKLWADLVYGGEADRYLTGQADGRGTRGPGNTFRLPAVALSRLFTRKRHLQHRIQENYTCASQECISTACEIKGDLMTPPQNMSLVLKLFQENDVWINVWCGRWRAHTCWTRKSHYSILLNANDLYSSLTVSLLYIIRQFEPPGGKNSSLRLALPLLISQ